MNKLDLEQRRRLFYPKSLQRNMKDKIALALNEWQYIKEQRKYQKVYYLNLVFRLLKIIIQREYFLMPQVDLVLTCKCTLKCKNCANLMQYYKHPYDVDKETIKRSVLELLKSVDYLRTILVLGGEPFIYKNLAEILEFLCAQRKIGQVLVVTNATIYPNDSLLINALKNPKVCIRISDYRQLSRNEKQLIQLCKKKNIYYRVIKQGRWYLPGNVQSRNRTSEQLQKQFRECATLCRSLLNGHFYYCAREAHLTDLKFAPDCGEYVELLTEKNEAQRRKEIYSLCSQKKSIAACDYCDVRTIGYEETKIKTAEQTKTVLEQ